MINEHSWPQTHENTIKTCFTQRLVLTICVINSFHFNHSPSLLLINVSAACTSRTRCNNPINQRNKCFNVNRSMYLQVPPAKTQRRRSGSNVLLYCVEIKSLHASGKSLRVATNFDESRVISKQLKSSHPHFTSC